MRRTLVCLPLLIAACGEAPDSYYLGYVEGDYRLIAPEVSGRIETVAVTEGQRVNAGDVLFALDAAVDREQLTAARARLEAAMARFDDAAAGGREPEIEAARDQLLAARASQQEAAENLARQRELFAQGIVPRARLDEAEAAATATNARVAEMRQRVTLASLPARENQLRALTAEIEAAQSEVDRIDRHLERYSVNAPAGGMVERQIRYEGELAGPGQPVLRLLPDGALHAAIFIPEADIGHWSPGDTLLVDCLSCAAGLSVTLTRIDPEPSFTPPVIYSEDQRARLVFRAEAAFGGAPPPAGTPLTLRPD
ncbi:HlyD family secretion protein [Hyphobacterium sp.]|uniref:HlyD family secretion protein n=1 Tax=Hyphobacterium sp. TaxID=2004662 RepID=UPI003B520532